MNTKSKKGPVIKKHPGMQAIQPSETQINAIKEQLVAKQFDAKYAEELNKVLFEPAELLDSKWREAAAIAMAFESPISMGIASTSMQEIYKKIQPACQATPLNLFEVAALNNIIETRTAAQLNKPMEEYFEVNNQCEKVTHAWNAIGAPLRATVAQEIRDSINIKQATDELQKPIGSFGGPIGEA